MTQDGPRPAPQRRVCRIDRGGGNPDPSRGGARDRPAGGRDDRGGLQDSVGGGGAPPARRRAGPRPDTRASSRRVRDRRRDKYRRAAHTLGTCAPEGPIPRGRSAERAPSTIHGHIRQNAQRLIRPAAASIRSRGPGGCCSRSSRLAQPRTPYLKPLCRGAPPHGRRLHPSPCGTILLSIRPECVGGPILASYPGSILASAEASTTNRSGRPSASPTTASGSPRHRDA